jgi:hypothetical protein
MADEDLPPTTEQPFWRPRPEPPELAEAIRRRREGAPLVAARPRRHRGRNNWHVQPLALAATIVTGVGVGQAISVQPSSPSTSCETP